MLLLTYKPTSELKVLQDLTATHSLNSQSKTVPMVCKCLMTFDHARISHIQATIEDRYADLLLLPYLFNSWCCINYSLLLLLPPKPSRQTMHFRKNCALQNLTALIHGKTISTSVRSSRCEPVVGVDGEKFFGIATETTRSADRLPWRCVLGRCTISSNSGTASSLLVQHTMSTVILNMQTYYRINVLNGAKINTKNVWHNKAGATFSELLS